MPVPLVLALLAVASAPAQGQRTPDVVVPPGGQVDPAPGDADATADQITRPQRSDAIDQLPRDAARRPAAAQVTSAKGGEARQVQITRERPGSGGAPQLGKGGRSAAAPPSPATRADGRRTDVVRVGGSDRCDPQATRAGDPRCAQVIEARSTEFSSPRAPVLSPEQRLLLDQERGEQRGVRAAAQRVARNEVDPNALDTQALAAISLGVHAETTTATADPAIPAGAEAIIQIIEAVQSATPRR